ncbi:alpha-tocopherol transfer protein-like [Photinus pyralis]|uniref:alpha-tocopherol transfer protein-like n=1 Tax=Photinus pyralis TaxID=7054 RepID=UPI0012670139|nr:alpha-tocopherol transfer protein-like [Photinus pyralis]
METYSIRPLSKELNDKAAQEINEDPKRVQETLKMFHEWIRKQPHLNVRNDDQHLITFLRGCKWSLQLTKQKIDYFYTLRTLVPDLFRGRDSTSQEIQLLLKSECITLLPNEKGYIGPKTFFMSFNTNVPFLALMKAIFMSIEILMKEDDNSIISGFQIISDYQALTPGYMLQFTPALVKKCVICIENMSPLRMKGQIGINVPKGLVVIYHNFARPFFSDKLKERINFLTESNWKENVSRDIQSVLPQEYGGDNPPLNYIADKWAQKVMSYRDWFLEDDAYGCDESRRPLVTKAYQELGIEGSFRKLVID